MQPEIEIRYETMAVWRGRSWSCAEGRLALLGEAAGFVAGMCVAVRRLDDGEARYGIVVEVERDETTIALTDGNVDADGC